MQPLITILGPTACGKTHIATETAYRLGGEVISADSRQVYRGMDIGTGKDLEEYTVHGNVHIPYHLIDIRQPGYEYSAGEFYRDFWQAYDDIQNRGKVPVLCGGTGLYIESVLKQYPFALVPENHELRQQLHHKTDQQLAQMLQTYVKLHNHTDTENRDRMVRAIEIHDYQQKHPHHKRTDFKSIVFGIAYPRQTVMQRIRQRLEQRLDEGMVDEIRTLINNGVSPERLDRYGLEYRYVTRYILGDISYSQMLEQLNIAIRQFAKRQMTWFRRMERNGTQILWIDPQMEFDKKIEFITGRYKEMFK